MALLPIRRFPDPVLREPAAPVPAVDDAVRKLITDMGQTMRAAPGIGLAAPQVGVQRRVLVYSLSEEDDIHAVINPEIVLSEGEVIDSEGCLSLPGISYEVPRAQRVIVRGLDGEGEPIEIDAEDLEARVLQHEVDHLDGKLFIDRISDDLRREALRMLREQALGTVGVEVRQPTGSL